MVTALLALLAGCSSGGSPDTSPLSTAASAPPFYCGFVSKNDVQIAVGTDHLGVSGSVQYLTGQQRNPDGGRLGRADCTVNDKNGQAFGAEVMPIVDRPDLAQQVVDTLARHKPGDGLYVFPRSFGVGWCQPSRGENPATGATVYLLRGNWFVNVGITGAAEGRDPVKDAVALTHQIVAFLRLPTTHTKPYPTPSPSS